MRLILAFILLPLLAQAQISEMRGGPRKFPAITAAGGGSSGPGIYLIVTNVNTASQTGITNVMTSLSNNTVLVTTLATEFDSTGAWTGGVIPASAGGFGFTNNQQLVSVTRAHATAASSGETWIYTTIVTNGGSINLTATDAGHTGPAKSMVTYAITNAEAVLGGAASTATAQNQPNVTLTTTRASSLIFNVDSDWAARAGTPTARLGAISCNHDVTTASYRGVHIYYTASTATGYGMGYTGANTAGNNACGVANYEVRGP